MQKQNKDNKDWSQCNPCFDGEHEECVDLRCECSCKQKNDKDKIEEKTKIAVICTNCDEVIIESIEMSREEAEKILPKLDLTGVFNAPRCKKCKNFEPYDDINVGHKLILQTLKEEE
jgi:hypothetical protein